MENFKEAFLQKIQLEIDSPSIKILHFKMNEPVSEEIIKKVENKFGFELDSSIKSFYRQCNGISYRAYQVNLETEKSGIEKGKVWSNEFIEWGSFCDDNKTDWILNDAIKRNDSIRHLYIRPLDDVLLGTQYLIDEDDEEEENLYLLDAWRYYYPIMLSVNKDEESFEVIIGDDYGADYTSYKPISFQEYLESLIKNPLSLRFFDKREFTSFSF